MIIQFNRSNDQEDSQVIDLAVNFLASIDQPNSEIDYSVPDKIGVSFPFHDKGMFPLEEISESCGVTFTIRGLLSTSFEAVIPSFEDYRAAASAALEAKAHEYGYDNIVSACSYSTSTIEKFQKEGKAFAKWRDLLWIEAFSMNEAAEASGNWPSIEEAIAALPAFEDVLASVSA